MGMGFAPTWLRQVSPPASQNHSNHRRHSADSSTIPSIANTYVFDALVSNEARADNLRESWNHLAAGRPCSSADELFILH